MDELLPCPFCGSKAEWISCDWDEAIDPEGFVQCTGCSTGMDTIEEWNTRNDESTRQEEREEIKRLKSDNAVLKQINDDFHRCENILVSEIESLKADLMDARVRGNAFRDVSKKLKAEMERKDEALKDCHHFLSDLEIEPDEDSCGMAFIKNRVSEDGYYITLNNAKNAITRPEEDGE